MSINTAADIFGSSTTGHDVSVSGLGPDGCTCAAMLWVFLPCWVGLSNHLSDTRKDASGRHGVLQHQAQQRGVHVDELKDAIVDDWNSSRNIERFDAESKLNKESRLSVRGWKMLLRPQTKQSLGRRRRHQSGCYCGMPSRDAAGNVCANPFLRPPTFSSSSTLDRTLAMIKPDAVQHREEIRELIKEHGFTIAHERVVRLTNEEAGEFYLQDSTKPFYEDLKRYISSGRVVAMELTRHNAVEQWRRLIGNKMDVYRSDNETLRSLFGTDQLHTGLHGSDSYLSAECEIRFFFPEVNFDPVIVDDEEIASALSVTLVDRMHADTCKQPSYPTMLTYV